MAVSSQPLQYDINPHYYFEKTLQLLFVCIKLQLVEEQHYQPLAIHNK